MFMRDHPPPVDFLQANRQTKIERLGLAVGIRSGAVHRRDSEGDISASRDVHLLNLKADQIARPGKEEIPGLLVSVEPTLLNGGGTSNITKSGEWLWRIPA
jgi:hypothetical protein